MTDTRTLQIERLELFSNATIVKSLCSPRAFQRMLNIRDSVVLDTDIRRDDLAVGYELIIQAALHGILDLVISSPELLGICGDDRLFRWWTTIQGGDGTILNAAIGDTNSDLARIAVGIDELITSFRRSGVSWDRIAEVNGRAEILADELLEMACECSVSIIAGVVAPQDVRRVMKWRVVRHLDEYWRHGADSEAFRYSRRLRTEWEQMQRPSDFMFDIQSHRDQMRRLPEYDPEDFESGWLIGKLGALAVSLMETGLWDERLPEPEQLLRKHASHSRAWKAGNRVLCAAAAKESDLKECEFGLEVQPGLPSTILTCLSGPLRPAATADRLAVLFGRSAQLIGSRDVRSRLHVETVVSGLACNLPKDRPIEILRIFHGPESDGVSLAVFMPAAGSGSVWWVFDRPYRVRDSDPSSNRGLTRIDDIAKKLEKSIDYIDLLDVPAERMLELCDDRAFQYLSRQFKEKERIASDIRGVFPELLCLVLLSQAGYHLVKTSVEILFDGVGEREIDAIGVQLPTDGGDCKIIEVKGGSASRYELEEKVLRFAETMHLAGEHRSLVADILGWSEPIKNVSGLFIAMAAHVDVPKRLWRLGIEIWDLSRFKQELRDAGLPEKHVELLEQSLEVWEEGGWNF